MSICGYAGRILFIDLSRGNYHAEELPRDLASKYIGGKGMGARILYDRLKPGTDPLSADNLVVFATGPLTGTLAPTAGRTVLCTKSPLTGLWLDSNCGGFLGPQIKAAGYDVIVIEGKAEQPTVVVIDEDKIIFEPAGELWGMDTFTTHTRLKEKWGKETRVACIGPAGENLVAIAAVISEGRAFGRGGAGAVLGAKNLKAIAVKGNRPLEIYDYEAFMNINREAINEISINQDTGGSRPRYGTNAILSFMVEAGVHPVKNFQQGTWPGVKRLNESILARDYYKKHKACFGCPIRCSKASRVEGGKYRGAFTEGPDYENTWSFGAQCGIDDPAVVIKAEYLSDYYGLDAISAGNAIGFGMECYEKGLLSRDEVGFELTFGNDEALLTVLEQMARKEGVGALLGQGVKRAAVQIGGGSEKFAMHVKGLELPAYDPRGAVAMGLAYATSDRGACHLRAWPVGAEVLNPTGKMDRFDTEFKAEYVKNEQDYFAVIDSLGVCLFANFGLSPRQLVRFLYSLTGLEELNTTAKLMQAGERIYNLTRLFSLRENREATVDTLPERLVAEPLADGPTAGHVVPLAKMLDEYYRARHWDENGVPRPAKLKQLGLSIEE